MIQSGDDAAGAKRYVFGLDIGSNSVGSATIDLESGEIIAGVSVFPAGVDESDDKRGEPKNAKRRMTRRTRITLARRSERKRELRLTLIGAGLLPKDETGFKALLEATDPWALRRKGLDEALTPHEFGRVLLHLAQRRGALGLRIADPEEGEEESADAKEDGKVKAAIGEVRVKMLDRGARTFGEFIAMVRDERITPIESNDKRNPDQRKGPREWRQPVRNKAASYEHCADRPMIRDEFARLWKTQKELGSETAKLLTDDLCKLLDNEKGDSVWRHKGLLFGQRRATWDLGTLGRCALEPSERCAPHADMHASRYLVVETLNNLRVIEGTSQPRPLNEDERERLREYLSGPLGVETRGKRKGQPKRAATITDLRRQMAEWYGKEHWTATKKNSPRAFTSEFTDEDRAINTDWFYREIVHGAIGADAWEALPDSLKEGFNRAILRHDPDEDGEADKLKAGVMKWGGLDEERADRLIGAWKARPKLDAKRLNMSRKAVRNTLAVMDHAWPDDRSPTGFRWPTQIEARKAIAGDADFRDAATGKPMDDITRRRYATGAKGATARDRYYMGKHTLQKDGQPIIDKATGEPLAEPPPAPLISNPVVRKAIHEVRRHVVEHMMVHGRKPDQVTIELAREAKMGKMDADRLLLRNRLRNCIRNDIIETHHLHAFTSTQQRAAVDRVVLALQQGQACPLCGQGGLTPEMAASGTECEVAHIIPRASGGHNGLSNIVLSHTRCNREMGRRTPRQYWSDGAGFDQGMRWVEGIYSEVQRAKPSEIKNASGPSLWSCYFNARDDRQKIERFKKDVSDQEVQGFQDRQLAATTYASRQVMAYLSDALYDGKGLPERATGLGGADDARTIFASDGQWTSRLRREWGLFFDSHGARAKGLGEDEENERKEKNRGDHHHHAIDAVVVALGSRDVQMRWERREKAAEAEVTNAADEEAMENFRRRNRLRPPPPFDYPSLPVDEAIDRFRAEVKKAVFGEDGMKPICHRPVKRKLVGALHKETLFGPVINQDGKLTANFTAKKSVLALSPAHLRLPRPETDKEAVERLALRHARDTGTDEKSARKWARKQVGAPGFTPAIIDPPPEMSGIVRDRTLRMRLRQCLEENGLDPDKFTSNEIKKLHESGKIAQASGVPIYSVVLLRTMGNPVIIDRKQSEYGTGRMVRDRDPNSLRAYDSQNNHHIEIREDAKGKWRGDIVTAYQAAQRKLAKIRAFREAGVPRPSALRKLPVERRREWRPTISKIEAAHPIVDRTDIGTARFVMSLCEGEMLWMRRKPDNKGEAPGAEGYFVVAKMSEGEGIVLVPHWDARAAGERKDAEGKKVPHSKRDQFAATPSDLKTLAPDGQPHARKVRVSALGEVTLLDGD